MRFDKIFLPAILLALSLAASAQTAPSVMDVGLDYTFIHANAPPALCGCFSLNGGGGTLVLNAPHGLSLVADLSAAHAANINRTTQTVTIFDYLFGPRYSYRSAHRFTPYVEALAGGSHESSNYTYVQSVSAFAFSAGGGLSTTLQRRITWNIVEADYIYSRLPNAVNTRQSDLRITTGVSFRFGVR